MRPGSNGPGLFLVHSVGRKNFPLKNPFETVEKVPEGAVEKSIEDGFFNTLNLGPYPYKVRFEK